MSKLISKANECTEIIEHKHDLMNYFLCEISQKHQKGQKKLTSKNLQALKGNRQKQTQRMAVAIPLNEWGLSAQ